MEFLLISTSPASVSYNAGSLTFSSHHFSAALRADNSDVDVMIFFLTSVTGAARSICPLHSFSSSDIVLGSWSTALSVLGIGFGSDVLPCSLSLSARPAPSDFIFSSSAWRIRSVSACCFLFCGVWAIFFQISTCCLACSMAALRSRSATIFSAMVVPPLGWDCACFFNAASLSASMEAATFCATCSSPPACSTMASQAVSGSACS